MTSLLLVFIGPLLLFLGEFFAPKGYWELGSRPKRTPAINLLAEQARAQESKQIGAMLDSKLAKSKVKDNDAYQLNKLLAAIEYAIQRHDWYEGQRVNILNSSLTAGGLLVAGIGLFAENVTTLSDPQKSIVFGIILTVVVALGIIVFEYQSQLDRDRPYRLTSDVRHWYYRYQLPERATHIGDRLDFDKIASDQLEERLGYVKSLLENFDFVKSIREDIEQLYILHVLQRYKSESLQRMRWAFSYFIFVLGLEALVLAYITFYCIVPNA
jgi:hypothetical protein